MSDLFIEDKKISSSPYHCHMPETGNQQTAKKINTENLREARVKQSVKPAEERWRVLHTLRAGEELKKTSILAVKGQQQAQLILSSSSPS